MKIDFEEGSRKISINSQEVLLPGPISHTHLDEKKVLVILDADWGIRNVFCFNLDGVLLWVIEETEYFKGVPGPGYQTVYRTSNKGKGDLVARVRDRPFYLDLETGRVTFIPGNFER